MEDVSSKLAKYEIGWWKAHHRRQKNKAIENMAKEYQLQFGLTYDEALKCVKYRVDASKEHDIAEKLEDEGKQGDADVHWNYAEGMIKSHFEFLLRHQKGRSN